MKPTFIVVNGILTRPGDVNGWTDVMEDLYANAGIPCHRYEYFSGALTRRLFIQKRVNEICKIIKRISTPLVYVGHSNGCELFSRVVRQSNRDFVAAHLFAAAMNDNFIDNGMNHALVSRRLGRLYLYCSKGDTVLRDIAGVSECFKWLGLGYGRLGYLGPKAVSRLVDDRVDTMWVDKYNHSDWLNDDHIEDSFKLTLRGISHDI